MPWKCHHCNEELNDEDIMRGSCPGCKKVLGPIVPSCSDQEVFTTPWFQQGRYQAAIFLGFIILLALVCNRVANQYSGPVPAKSASGAIQSSATTNSLHAYDQQVATDIRNRLQSSGVSIVERLSLDRTTDRTITVIFHFKPCAMENSREQIETALRGWCTNLAGAYNRSQWITVRAKVNDIIVAQSEYSPLTGQVK